MAYTDFIAVIDLGTSHIVGMIGTKSDTGALSILAYESENSDGCIRRGCVYNIKDAAFKIQRIIQRLENKLDGAKIAKIYIGVGGQSLRTVDHVVSKVLGSGVVTEEVLSDLEKECRQYQPELLDVLNIASPVYYLDNEPETHPLGMNCSRIEAHYKLVVGRPSLRKSAAKIAEQLKIEVVDVIVSPFALSELVLSEQEKEQGCALINFGAGVTSVTMYQQGKLKGLYVIPLGSQLITRDLMTLQDQMLEKEAERIKRTFGNAIYEKETDRQDVSVDLADGRTSVELKMSDINNVVSARAQELLENVHARLKDAGVAKEPGYSLVISGGGSALKNIREGLGNLCDMNVRYASVRKNLLVKGEMIANNLDYMTAAALLLKGAVNCAYVKPEPVPVPKVEPKPDPKPVEPIVPTPQENEDQIKGGGRPQQGQSKQGEQKKSKGIGFFRTLFDVDELGSKLGGMMDEE